MVFARNQLFYHLLALSFCLDFMIISHNCDTSKSYRGLPNFELSKSYGSNKIKYSFKVFIWPLHFDELIEENIMREIHSQSCFLCKLRAHERKWRGSQKSIVFSLIFDSWIKWASVEAAARSEVETRLWQSASFLSDIPWFSSCHVSWRLDKSGVSEIGIIAKLFLFCNSSGMYPLWLQCWPEKWWWAPDVVHKPTMF